MNTTEATATAAELALFRDAVRRFVETELAPHEARWRAQQHVDRAAWRKAGDMGLLLSLIHI